MRQERTTHLLRLGIYRIVIVAVFLAMIGQLWRLQIEQGTMYRVLADRNRFRQVTVPGPRGVMYDRNGHILVRNRPSFAVAIVPADLPEDEQEAAAVIHRLAELLGAPEEPTGAITQLPPLGNALPRFRLLLSEREMREHVEKARWGAAYRPIPVATQVDRDLAFQIEEMRHTLPGVHLIIEPIREYIAGPLTAHILGYMGPIPEAEAKVYEEKGYNPNDLVGLTGLEYTYESELRGRAGSRFIEVDVFGREIRTVAEIKPPVPGHNLILTIDLALQTAMEAALRKGLEKAGSRSGVAIAMNPKTGEILGMVSLPSYDNNLFARGISVEEYKALLSDPARPLVNHAISGLYPPGSTFKIIPAAAALEEKVITPKTLIHDEGVLWVPNQYFPDDPSQAQPFYCWIHKYGRGHGDVNITAALAVSCDVFFYVVAGGYKEFRGLGEPLLAYYAREFGLGELSGIDLPAENPGLVPDSRWKRITLAESWVTGDTYNMAIGQGFVLATPLQILNATAAVANGGYLYRPQLVYQIIDAEGQVVRDFQPQLIRELPISPENLEIVRQGLYGAVHWPGGTGHRADVPGIEVAGKTGTAEYPGKRDEKGNLPTHAWFTAFAPYQDPEIAVVVFIEGGGEGSEVAAPVAAEILKAYFYPSEPGGPVEEEAAPAEPPKKGTRS
ncbi:MAG TPA: penicillin-binding protein 2 [Caldilineae bacterium]|nr:penicillin-binding protein 2 [Caldilineae bacterium]